MKRCEFLQKVMTAALLFVFPAPSCLAQTAQSQAKGPDVLIVYSSGNKPVDGGQPDAMTTPTPGNENMKTVTDKLAASLSSKKLTVRVALAHEIKTPDEIFSSRILVVGSPSYFWNVSWQIKKFFDERFSEMSSRKERLGKHPVAAYTQAGGKDGADLTIAAVREAVNRWNGTFGPTMTLLAGNKPEEVKQTVEKFAGEIAALLK
ncbi:MAG: hypothetical protein Q8O92_15405 [Candidatus Latescibacter sp.]|nr:hypothetical protein [Candidatus Latescibacter sp.]